MKLQFVCTVSEDDDHTPWGEPEVIAEETRKIERGVWAPYVVTVRVAGPGRDGG